MIRQFFLTLKRNSSKIDQPLRENPICKIIKANAVVTKGAAGKRLFKFLTEISDHQIMFLLVFESLSLFDFGGNPSSFLLFASPIINNNLIV